MASDKSTRKEKTQNQNIQVFVRVRPLNQREREIKSHNCIEVVSPREVNVKLTNAGNITKKFTFDRAFGPHSEQVEVYHEVVSPLIEEVLNGYNCTVFAYGQTGTGKTHTMVGENSGADEARWQDDPLAGIIPRSLSQLFDELRIRNTEYTVRVSYLELYNEELFDLLSSSEDNSKLRIYEDITKKGSNIVNGLEEITVYNKNEVYKIMERGQEKKKVASTLMNAQSSRSHTVFTIVVHMKENSPEGEELLKIGKLNLVDLAGSENISKAGSDNPSKRERARECVNINQSLLTLGRVITALVERHPHIPYRESKLTRLLQESLGGRTKTSIIATISPGHKDQEETLSTLEYAHRAKNIQNKPEVNQKLTKKAVLKEYSEEIDRLKKDLYAARERNGIYLANETYEEMIVKLDHQDKEIQDKIHAIKALKDEKDRFENILKEMAYNLKNAEEKLEKTTEKLSSTKQQLSTTRNILSTTKELYKEQKFLVTKHSSTEEVLTNQAQEILSVADVTTLQLNILHENVDRRRQLENTNVEAAHQYSSSAQGQRQRMRDRLNLFSTNITDQLALLRDTYDKQHSSYLKTVSENNTVMEDLVKKMTKAVEECEESNQSTEQRVNEEINTKKRRLNETLESHAEKRRDLLRGYLQQFTGEIDRAKAANVENFDRIKTMFDEMAKSSMSKLDALVEEQKVWWDRMTQHNKEVFDVIVTDFNEQKEESLRERQELREQIKEMDENCHRLASEVQTLLEKRSNFMKRFDDVSESRAAIADGKIENYTKMFGDSARCMNDFNSAFESSVKSNKEGANNMMEDLTVRIDEGKRCIDEKFEGISAMLKDATAKTLEEEDSSMRDLTADTDAALESVKEINKQVIVDNFTKIQAFNEIAKTNLEAVSSTSGEMSNAIEQDMSAHIETAQSLARSVTDYKDNVERQLNSYDAMEENFLSKQITTYAPTGRTPVRQEFRYPRQLVATSPHERILQRYRQGRNVNINEQECIDLDNSVDVESSSACSSADSSTMFAEPLPPTPTKLADTDKENLNASNTSIASQSSDISVGSKNGNGTFNNKYQSRLRQPTHNYKRPLADKN